MLVGQCIDILAFDLPWCLSSDPTLPQLAQMAGNVFLQISLLDLPVIPDIFA